MASSSRVGRVARGAKRSATPDPLPLLNSDQIFVPLFLLVVVVMCFVIGLVVCLSGLRGQLRANIRGAVAAAADATFGRPFCCRSWPGVAVVVVTPVDSSALVVSSGRRRVAGMVRDLVVRARSVSEACLVMLPRRWAHVQGVAEAGALVARLADSRHADEIVAACWLHDVGYAAEIAETGFHPVDGARFAQRVGFPPLVVSLIAFHTGADVEAAERGLSGDLAKFDAPPADVLDVVTFADMTTAVDGTPIDADARVAEILTRYEPGDPVHRAVSASAPGLLASVGRVQARLAAAAGASG